MRHAIEDCFLAAAYGALACAFILAVVMALGSL